MAQSRTPRTPSYRHHKASGQAFVEIAGSRHYLGKWGLPETEQAYHRAIGEWIAGGRRPVLARANSDSGLTVTEVCAHYWLHVERTYQRPQNYKPTLRLVRKLYGGSPAASFGPLALRALREAMVAEGWSRRYVNRNVDRVQAMFRWAKNEQLIPAAIYDAIRDVPGLRIGQTTAPETLAVRPVSDAMIEVVKPHVSAQVWAMIELQRHTGARPGEVCVMRAVDIDTSGPTWFYRPPNHKNAHRGKARVIALGPKARSVVAPFLAGVRIDAYLFSPRDAERQRRIDAHAKRVTPLSCGNRPSTNAAANLRRIVGDRYTTTTYARAITRGIKMAFRPDSMTNRELERWKCPHAWSPNQIRHTKGTSLRRAEGVENARVYLGHSKVETTQIYAEVDEAKMVELAEKYG